MAELRFPRIGSKLLFEVESVPGRPESLFTIEDIKVSECHAHALPQAPARALHQQLRGAFLLLWRGAAKLISRAVDSAASLCQRGIEHVCLGVCELDLSKFSFKLLHHQKLPVSVCNKLVEFLPQLFLVDGWH